MLIDRIMEQCEIVRKASIKTDSEKRSSLFSAKGRNTRKISAGLAARNL